VLDHFSSGRVREDKVTVEGIVIEVVQVDLPDVRS
jgi:hypothetical protein